MTCLSFSKIRFAACGLAWAAALALSSAHAANQPTPAGIWRAVDDETGAPTADIQMVESDGTVSGRIVRTLQPASEPGQDVCAKCPAELQGLPLTGLQIIKDLRHDQDATTWSGGQILDPETGKSYRLKIQLRDNGQTMQVRGYVGPFYREQLWRRVGDQAGASSQKP